MPGADERQDCPRPGPAKEAGNARKPPAGSGNISDTQDPLHKIEEFLRGKIETGAMHFSPARRPDYLSIRVKRGVGFLVHDSPNKGIFLEWWLNGAGEHWYEEKRTRLSTYHIDSHIHFTRAAISEPRLHIPVHKRPYGEAVLDIIKIIKDIMGY